MFTKNGDGGYRHRGRAAIDKLARKGAEFRRVSAEAAIVTAPGG